MGCGSTLDRGPKSGGIHLDAQAHHAGAMPRQTYTGPRPTLRQMRQGACWVRVNCQNTKCRYRDPVAVATLIIRWGGDASSDMLRRSAKCSQCGRKGASLTAPSWAGADMASTPFPERY